MRYLKFRLLSAMIFYYLLNKSCMISGTLGMDAGSALRAVKIAICISSTV